MPNTIDKVRIHNALIDLLQAGPYYAVTHDSSTKHAADVDEAVDTAVSPSSAAANEVSSSYDVDSRHGRDYKRSRSRWSWLGIVKFDQEVTSWRAEESWLNSPLILPSSAGFRQATLELAGATYQHPIKQQGHNGSVIEFTFEIRLSRR